MKIEDMEREQGYLPSTRDNETVEDKTLLRFVQQAEASIHSTDLFEFMFSRLHRRYFQDG